MPTLTANSWRERFEGLAFRRMMVSLATTAGEGGDITGIAWGLKQIGTNEYVVVEDGNNHLRFIPADQILGFRDQLASSSGGSGARKSSTV